MIHSYCTRINSFSPKYSRLEIFGLQTTAFVTGSAAASAALLPLEPKSDLFYYSESHSKPGGCSQSCPREKAPGLCPEPQEEAATTSWDNGRSCPTLLQPQPRVCVQAAPELQPLGRERRKEGGRELGLSGPHQPLPAALQKEPRMCHFRSTTASAALRCHERGAHLKLRKVPDICEC